MLAMFSLHSWQQVQLFTAVTLSHLGRLAGVHWWQQGDWYRQCSYVYMWAWPVPLPPHGCGYAARLQECIFNRPDMYLVTTKIYYCSYSAHCVRHVPRCQPSCHLRPARVRWWSWWLFAVTSPRKPTVGNDLVFISRTHWNDYCCAICVRNSL